jgi:hypothetical protein
MNEYASISEYPNPFRKLHFLSSIRTNLKKHRPKAVFLNSANSVIIDSPKLKADLSIASPDYKKQESMLLGDLSSNGKHG